MISDAAHPVPPRRRARIAAVGRRLAGLIAIAGLTGLAGVIGAVPAAADPPGNLASEITDTAGVLGADTTSVQQALDTLRTDTGYQLFVAFVPTFDGLDGQSWADKAATASGFGRDDVLLAVAVDEGRYGFSVDNGIALTDAQLSTVERTVETHLHDGDWAGAAIAAADGLRTAAGGGTAGGGSGGGNGLLIAAAIGLLAIGLIWFLARRRGAASTDPARLPTAELGKRASAALVALDDAVKTSEQELGFAQAQFGVEATRAFGGVLTDAKAALARAFALRQKLDDAEPETEPQAREMMTQILDLCRAADEQLDAQAEEFDKLRDLQSHAPQVLAETRQRATEVASRLPGARAALQSLATTYSPAALTSVTPNADQAENLLAGAQQSVEQGLAVVDTDRAAAVSLARAAEDAVEQAVRLLDAVDHARADLAEVGAKVDAGLASIGADVADAGRLAPQDPAVSAAAQVARQVITDATAARQGGDQLGALRRLTEAEAALDAALAPAREQADRLERARTQLASALGQVTSQIRSVSDFIETRRGAVGAEARTRLAEAARLAQEAERTSATDPAGALGVAQQAGQLAGSAQQLAEADVQRWQSQRSGPGGGTTSMVLGGILLDQVLRGGMGGMGGRAAPGSRGGGFGGGFSAPRSTPTRSAGSFGGGGTRGRRSGGGRF